MNHGRGARHSGGPDGSRSKRNGHDPNLAFIKLNQKITKTRRAEELLELMDVEGDGFNDVNMSTCLHRLGKCYAPFFEGRREPLAGLKKVMQLCELGIARGELTSRSLSNVAWGLARAVPA